jgi:adenylate cyclase class 2
MSVSLRENRSMTFEVELKFPLSDAADITLQLLALGAARGRVVEQYDLYFQHPSRDFRQTHEALRIRRSAADTFITYKGPLLDTRTKMRHEVEIPFGREAADFDRFRDLLATLGFESVRAVEKTRALYHLIWSRRDLELAIDAVDGLGTFLEIESLAEESDRDAARDAILDLAGHLGLKNAERRSYLQLLTEKAAEASPEAPQDGTK